MESQGGTSYPLIRRSACYDAVVLVPGIMGSRLYDTENNCWVWGMEQVVQYSLRWRHRRGLRALHVTDAEREGRTGRIKACGLLEAPAWAPVLRGQEPYRDLVDGLRTAVAHPDAILEFAYDWRLSVDHNAALLARAATDHLAAWRRHPAYDKARQADPDARDAQLVMLAHSMGGLLCWAMAGISGASDDVRATLTFGTPFQGAVKTTEMLNSGRGAPGLMSRKHVGELAKTLPGLHDLLPTYRCLQGRDGLSALTVSDVAAIGGDADLSKETFERFRRLADTTMVGHRRFVGTGQETSQSLRMVDGRVLPMNFRVRLGPDGAVVTDPRTRRPIADNHKGDGTVYRYAGDFPGTEENTVVQQHQSLGRSKTVIDAAYGLLTHIPEREFVLGKAELGLVVPEFVPVGEPFDIVATDVTEPDRVSCRVENTGSYDETVARPTLYRRDHDDQVTATVTIRQPGLYRVAVSGGAEPVTQLVMVDRLDNDDSD
ncbi:hypothetical protein ACFWM1_03390 [Nocardia sp. NPDC058379]|uniref:lipase/acyltransferase domain-containing protein n=1 Tax=unclassified Nocardia TaxID=2637762 RepID=UPI003652AECF